MTHSGNRLSDDSLRKTHSLTGKTHRNASLELAYAWRDKAGRRSAQRKNHESRSFSCTCKVHTRKPYSSRSLMAVRKFCLRRRMIEVHDLTSHTVSKILMWCLLSPLKTTPARLSLSSFASKYTLPDQHIGSMGNHGPRIRISRQCGMRWTPLPSPAQFPLQNFFLAPILQRIRCPLWVKMSSSSTQLLPDSSKEAEDHPTLPPYYDFMQPVTTGQLHNVCRPQILINHLPLTGDWRIWYRQENENFLRRIAYT